MKIFLYIYSMKKVYIYRLKHPITKKIRYVGKTININQRLQNHICEARTNKGKRHVLNWINSLLKLNLKPDIEIIEICTDLNWQEREQFWIKHYRDGGFKLCNICDGGLGGSGVKNFSKEQRKVIGERASKQFSIFSNNESLDIWGKIQKGLSYKEIIKFYPKYTRNIHFQVSSGRVWRHITGLDKPEPCLKLHARSKFTKEDVLKIRSLHRKISQKEIAIMFNSKPGTIQKIIRKINYRNIE